MPAVLLGTLIAGYIGAVGRYLVSAHQAFYTFYDLAIYDQLFWNTLHGRFFITSLDAIHFSLGIHFSPIMLIYLPLYAIRPSPTTLLVARTMLLALSAIPIFLLLIDLWRSRWLALAGAALFLFSPMLIQVNVDNFFNPEAMIVPLLATAFLLLHREKITAFVVVCLIGFLVKEEITLTVAFLGLFAALVYRRRKIGAAVFLAGLAFFFFEVLWLVPHLGGLDHYNLRANAGYAYLGDDIDGVLRNLFLSPGAVAAQVFSVRAVRYLALALLPLGFLPLLAPATWLVALPALAINLVSANQAQTQTFSRYSAPLIPVLFVAFAFAAQRIRAWLEKRKQDTTLVRNSLLIAVFACSLLTHLLLSYPAYRPDDHAKAAQRMLTQVPTAASVKATQNFLPHLSQREHLYALIQPEQADYLLLETNERHWLTQWIAAHPPYADALVALRADAAYELIAEDDGILLYRSNALP